MFLIDQPYISSLLIHFLEEKHYPVIDTPEARKLISSSKINFLHEKIARKIISENPEKPIYSNSENAIAWIDKNLPLTKLPSTINFFKNKAKLRELIRNEYPGYFFKTVPFNDLKNTDISNISFPFILKPTIGFFSLSVYTISTKEEWEEALHTIYIEAKNEKQDYPLEVLNTSEFIIEEYIYGDEFAIDCYFTSSGKPVITNIMKHFFSSEKDVSDRVYISSGEIILNYHESMIDFLKMISKKTGVRNIPMHVEVRITEDQVIIPIEINPMRFGGWCTTADLATMAYGFSPYEYFMEGKVPDWKNILKDKEEVVYSLMVLENSTGFKAEEIRSFNEDKLFKDFEKILEFRKIDFHQYPVFGFLFTETRKKNMDELIRILHSDLREYIILK
jgi:ATP-grasp domain